MKFFKTKSFKYALGLAVVGMIGTNINQAFAGDRYAAAQDYDGAMTSTVSFEIESPIFVNSTDGLVGKIVKAAEVHHVKLYAMVGDPYKFTYTAIRAFDGVPVSGVVIVVSGDSV